MEDDATSGPLIDLLLECLAGVSWRVVENDNTRLEVFSIADFILSRKLIKSGDHLLGINGLLNRIKIRCPLCGHET